MGNTLVCERKCMTKAALRRKRQAEIGDSTCTKRAKRLFPAANCKSPLTRTTEVPVHVDS